MYFRSLVLGSVVMTALASSVEHLVDDADIKVHGATLDPISQCAATASRTFHHDGLKKDRRAHATFHFTPPRDGCYLIEERTALDAIQWQQFQNKNCKVSANTKVHVHYCKGLQAVGTVDQTPKGFGRQPQDQWTFIGALQFYAGIPGNVTLSNEGTEPGTLSVFDQVRFSWAGKDCMETHVHPRRVDLRMNVDFKHVADRLTIFGIALKKRLADMAGVPEESLRLTDLRSGSIIAEFLVLPSVSGLDVVSAKDSVELLRSAVSKNTAELCALSTGPLEGCNVELADLGFAKPSVKSLPMPEQHNVMQQQQEPVADENADVVIIVVCTVAAAVLLLFASYRLYRSRSRKTKIPSSNSNPESYETTGRSVEISMEEGHSVEEKAQDNDVSTGCPSISNTPREAWSDKGSDLGSSRPGPSPVRIGSPANATHEQDDRPISPQCMVADSDTQVFPARDTPPGTPEKLTKTSPKKNN